MKRILLTGMSGTGKSTIIQALKSMGYRTVDLDYDDWSEYRSDGEWVWREDRISELLDQKTNDTLFIAGCSINQGKFYSKFDLIILLSAPESVLLERLENRTNNPFGKDSNELAKIVEDLHHVEPLLRKGASHEIKTDKPLDEVIREIMVVLKKDP